MDESIRRRKWRRLLVGAAFVVLLLVVMALFQSSSFDRRAARLTLGQSVDEVRQIMGEPNVGNFPKSGIFFHPKLKAWKSASRWWEKLTGRRDLRRVRPGFMEENSVDVLFKDGRLVHIRRGNESLLAPDFEPEETP